MLRVVRMNRRAPSSVSTGLGAMPVVQGQQPHLAQRASMTHTSAVLSRKATATGLLRESISAAVEAAGKNLAKALAPRRVNMVSPGLVDTELWGPPVDREVMLACIVSGLPVCLSAALVRPTRLPKATCWLWSTAS